MVLFGPTRSIWLSSRYFEFIVQKFVFIPMRIFNREASRFYFRTMWVIIAEDFKIKILLSIDPTVNLSVGVDCNKNTIVLQTGLYTKFRIHFFYHHDEIVILYQSHSLEILFFFSYNNVFGIFIN